MKIFSWDTKKPMTLEPIVVQTSNQNIVGTSIARPEFHRNLKCYEVLEVPHNFRFFTKDNSNILQFSRV